MFSLAGSDTESIYERVALIGTGMVLTAADEYPKCTRGSTSLMVRRNEIIEGLLNYRRRNQASCRCTHEFRVTGRMGSLEEAMKTGKEQLRRNMRMQNN